MPMSKKQLEKQQQEYKKRLAELEGKNDPESKKEREKIQKKLKK